jgi:DNA repair photolyase
MTVAIREIEIKSALVRSRIPGMEFVINPYIGCGHGCRYCYAIFMRRHSHYNRESRWGEFVEVKTDIPEVLAAELARKQKRGSAFLSSVCDPYQPVERAYRLTRSCLELLRNYGWTISILTRSPLVIRDADILRSALDCRVGFSIPTDNDRVREKLEPFAPPIPDRIEALKRLQGLGIRTWAFIAPMLPMDPERLHRLLDPVVEEIKIDPLNYVSRVEGFFRQQGWGYALSQEYAGETRQALWKLFGEKTR